MFPSRSTRIGTLKPKALMLSATCRTCFLLWCRGLAGSGFETQLTSDFSAMLAAIRWRREVFQYSHFGLIVNSHRRYGNLVDKSPCRANTDGCGIGSNLVRGELAAFS